MNTGYLALAALSTVCVGGGCFAFIVTLLDKKEEKEHQERWVVTLALSVTLMLMFLLLAIAATYLAVK